MMLSSIFHSLLVALFLGAPGLHATVGPGEGADLEIGGPGTGKGTFHHLMDFTFDTKNMLYALDGGAWKKEERSGNFLVQIFDPAGIFVSEFSIFDETLGTKNEPARLAVDSHHNVWITQPKAGLVQQYDSAGKWLKNLAIPGALGVTVRTAGGREEIVVAANLGEKKEIDRLEIVTTSGELAQPLSLGRKITGCQDITADSAGNLYLSAGVHQVFVFEASGALRTVLGGGTRTRAEDGSELLHSVAVDSKGNIYSQTFGNPARLTRFDPQISTVTQREGQFKWADPWSTHSGYTIYVVDRNDRLWVGTTSYTDPKEKKAYHFQPCILRTQADFFDPKDARVSSSTALGLGLKTAIEIRLPYNISTALDPIAFDFVVKPGNRRMRDLSVKYHVYDMYKNEAAHGSFELGLEDGVEVRHPCSFTPPRWGWYTVVTALSSKGQALSGAGAHIGVTPPFPDMPVLAAGTSPGGWDDSLRLAFCGHRLQRVHTGGGLEKLEKDVTRAAQYGLTLLVQFENQKECTAEQVRAAVTRMKGRVKYWEIMNEPNFTMKPEAYAAMLKELYPLIKGIDPDAQVMGPTVCGIQLGWYEAAFKAGALPYLDIVSLHDYEGDESIDPGHWAYKIGELRKLMAAYGGEKPLWQTERAITGVRGSVFSGGNQAVRLMLQRDVMEALGIPNEHNLHYYLSDAGYGSVPSYLWSSAGPHPGALALRTRQAMTAGRRYAGTLDFGPTGNKIFMGLRFEGPEGSTLILRNLGTLDQALDLSVHGESRVEVIDSFGNTREVSVAGGKVALSVGVMPLYVRLARGQEAVAPKLDFGTNIAREATFSYGAALDKKTDMATLTNGVLEVSHAGNPHQNKYWIATLPQIPQTLDMSFAQPRAVSKMLIYSVRADNPHSALLDYDLQYHDGRTWVTLQEVRTPCPATDLTETPQCKADSWYNDENFFVHQFKPILTDKLRLLVRRTTLGFLPDAIALEARGGSMPPRLELREIEIYE